MTKHPAMILAILTTVGLLIPWTGEARKLPAEPVYHSNVGVLNQKPASARNETAPSARPDPNGPMICDHKSWDQDLEFRQCYQEALGTLNMDRHGPNGND